MGGDTSISTQNMSFRDNEAGYVDSRGTIMDPTRSVGFMQDTTLSEFFQRPVKILEKQWEVDKDLFVRFNPWKNFWENDRNIEKIKNYFLLKNTLHVKLLINGNAFYYGRALMAYEPLIARDNTSPSQARSDAYLPEDMVRLSQRMKVFINPTESTGGSLELPFFWDNSALRIPFREWDGMGDIVLKSFTPLRHANGATDSLTVTVFAWAENVSYAIPTGTSPSVTNEPEMADETDEDIISRPASAIARYAGALTNVPWISPFARATEIGAGAIASIAKIFGYSSPTNLDYHLMVPRPRTSLAVVDTKYPTNKLSVDSKQELTLDPATTGIRPEDELPIASIAGRESFLTSFDWKQEDQEDWRLFQIRADPFVFAKSGDEYFLPACAAAALPFSYWRGTMRLRFQIVSSAYHKGRLRIVYDPWKGENNPEFNTHYVTIHDISNEKDFTVDIGWAQNQPYRKRLDRDDMPFSSIAVIQGDEEKGNGVIGVYVLNRLTVPGTVLAPIKINVFVSFLDDFEVAAPSQEIGNWTFRNSNATGPIPTRQKGVVLMNEPEMEEAGGDDDCCDAPVADPNKVDEMADTLIETPDTTKLFFGEVIGSFRQMIKRTTLSEVVRVPERTDTNYFEIERAAFPSYGGKVFGSFFADSHVLQYSNGVNVVPCANTYLNYVSRMFLGWRGSVRWTFDTSSLNVSAGDDRYNSLTTTLSRRLSTGRTNKITDLPFGNRPEINIGPDMLRLGKIEALYGAFLGNTNVNPIQSVEVPFYLNKRFIPTMEDISYAETVEQPSVRFSTLLPASRNNSDVSLLKLYCAAGEDLNFFFFNGMPGIFYETELPTDPGP